MATLSDLVEKIAQVESLEAGWIAMIARRIREEGLIATHGRGPSAAKMTHTDAANLLIGVNATRGRAADAPGTVRAYRRLTERQFRSRYDPRSATSCGSLGDVLEQLVAGAAAGLFPALLSERFGYEIEEAFCNGDAHVEVRFRTSDPAAFVKMTRRPPEFIERTDEVEPWLRVMPAEVDLAFLPTSTRSAHHRKRFGDRVEETTIGYRTLQEIGRLIG